MQRTTTPTEKEAGMFAPVKDVKASQQGALDGHETSCTCCGLVLRSSLRMHLQSEMQAHAAWHARTK